MIWPLTLPSRCNRDGQGKPWVTLTRIRAASIERRKDCSDTWERGNTVVSDQWSVISGQWSVVSEKAKAADEESAAFVAQRQLGDACQNPNDEYKAPVG